MKEHGEWSSWTLRIGDKVFKNVRPMTVELKSYAETWEIVFTYNRGPLTFAKTDTIVFNSESKARGWFDYVYQGMFLGDPSITPPKLPKIERTNCHLSIVKDTL